MRVDDGKAEFKDNTSIRLCSIFMELQTKSKLNWDPDAVSQRKVAQKA
jgi:hypothetical protein